MTQSFTPMQRRQLVTGIADNLEQLVGHDEAVGIASMVFMVLRDRKALRDTQKVKPLVRYTLEKITTNLGPMEIEEFFILDHQTNRKTSYKILTKELGEEAVKNLNFLESL